MIELDCLRNEYLMNVGYIRKGILNQAIYPRMLQK